MVDDIVWSGMKVSAGLIPGAKLTTLLEHKRSEYNSKLWNNGTEAGKEQARKQKRRTSYYANVLVIKDPANPVNEGKIKIFKFGQKIFDKVMGVMKPEFADEEPVNPFDMFEGANFRIKIKMVAGYWNYDSSEFERASPLSEDETKLEGVFNAQYDIHEIIAEDKFKSYDELSVKLNQVLGLTGGSEPRQQQKQEPKEEKTEFDSYFKQSDETKTSETSTDDDDFEDFFKKLAVD